MYCCLLDNFFNLSGRISDGDGFKILVIVSVSKRYIPVLIFTAVPIGFFYCCVHGIAGHPVLCNRVFKGGTCLKKCFFETYRFSEDLDFTVPQDMAYDD